MANELDLSTPGVLTDCTRLPLLFDLQLEYTGGNKHCSS